MRIGAFLLIVLALPAHAASLRVSAAASLSDVLRKIGDVYGKGAIVFNFGASSTLARQIMEGAPADVFLSADEPKMDQLAARGLIVASSRRNLLSNTLVIVVPSDSHRKIASPMDLADPAVRRIAVAEPRTVPAGIYAEEYLRKLGVWPKITSKIIPTDNVRATLAAVESGNVEAGIVYKTDALISKGVRIAYDVPAAEGPAISYPAAVVADSRQKAAAQQFLDFLSSEKAKALFRKYGFLVR